MKLQNYFQAIENIITEFFNGNITQLQANEQLKSLYTEQFNISESRQTQLNAVIGQLEQKTTQFNNANEFLLAEQSAKIALEQSNVSLSQQKQQLQIQIVNLNDDLSSKSNAIINQKHYLKLCKNQMRDNNPLFDAALIQLLDQSLIDGINAAKATNTIYADAIESEFQV